jgi:hypothetical protein
VVGAPNKSDFGRSSGAAYVFNVNTGIQTAKLLPNDPKVDGYFGVVAISGNIALVGAEGNNAAYIFDVTTGAQTTKLVANDGSSGDSFGVAVAVSGNTAIVGARNDADLGPGSGSAYLFDIATGQQLAKLLPSDGAIGDGFGTSVAISGNIAIVGSPDNRNVGLRSGSVYVFDAATGVQMAKLVAVDGAMFDDFGVSVAVNGRTAIIGAYFDDDRGADSGSAYVFDIPTRSLLAKLHPNDAEAGDEFGNAVAVWGNTATIGAFWKTDTVQGAGAAYLFDVTNQLPEPPLSASLAAIGVAASALVQRTRRDSTA